MSRIALCSLSASLLFVPAIAAAQGRVVSVRRGVPQTTISGLVYDAELSTPLPLAEVFLLGPRARTEMVQGDGRFSKTGVQAGRYAVFVQARGYTSDTLQLQLEEGMALDLDVGLRPAATVSSIL